MQGALDSGSGRARSNNPASSPSSSSVSVLGLLQTVCTNPSAVLNVVDNHSQSTQPYASPNVMETVVKQLLQLAATSASASSAYHVTGAGSPLKNGVRACTCIVHLVLLQVWLEQNGWLYETRGGEWPNCTVSMDAVMYTVILLFWPLMYVFISYAGSSHPSLCVCIFLSTFNVCLQF